MNGRCLTAERREQTHVDYEGCPSDEFEAAQDFALDGVAYACPCGVGDAPCPGLDGAPLCAAETA